jgi:hypothetical protein
MLPMLFFILIVLKIINLHCAYADRYFDVSLVAFSYHDENESTQHKKNYPI